MRIGMSELVVVFIVALVVIGPDKLPRYAKKLGEALAVFRRATDEATEEIKKNVVEPLEEAQRPLRQAMEPVEELDKAVRGNVREVQSSLNGIGKKPAARPKADSRQAAESSPAADAAAEADDAPAADSAAEMGDAPAADSAKETDNIPTADGGVKADAAPTSQAVDGVPKTFDAPPTETAPPEPPVPTGAAE